MSVNHKPAAAWSRDSLTAWQWLKENTSALPHVGTSPERCRIKFLRRWAVKILCLVNDEMDFCDWYWFLDSHLEKELREIDPTGPKLGSLMFRNGEYEPDRQRAERGGE
jgi:hypothetical protein